MSPQKHERIIDPKTKEKAKICRTCLKHTEFVKSIFNKSKDEVEDENLSKETPSLHEMLTFYTSFEV